MGAAHGQHYHDDQAGGEVKGKTWQMESQKKTDQIWQTGRMELKSRKYFKGVTDILLKDHILPAEENFTSEW